MSRTERLSTEDIRTRYHAVRAQLAEAAQRAGRSPDSVRLIAVTKTHPASTVETALAAGLALFGENYVQELREKMDYFDTRSLPVQPQWHFIGHLQRNKVKYIARQVALIHSVDSAALAGEIDKQAKKYGRTIDVLLQVNTSGEESKFGCAPDDTLPLAEHVLTLPHVRVRGLMTIAAFADDAETTRPMFRLLRSLRDDLQMRFPQADFSELSMGMTNDFATAIEEGATYIRIGTALFGERPKAT